MFVRERESVCFNNLRRNRGHESERKKGKVEGLETVGLLTVSPLSPLSKPHPLSIFLMQ